MPLFKTVFEWAKARGLNHIVGPKGMSPFDGYGIQVEGFEHRQMMTMMNYNYDYYQKLVETLGFEKEVDFVSCYIRRSKFSPGSEESNLIADKVVERGTFKVIRFKNKPPLVKYADRICEAYNKTFVNNWEYYPLTTKEVKFVVDQVITLPIQS